MTYQSKLIPLLCTIAVFLQFNGKGNAGTSESIAWQRLETKHTIIFYQSDEDLKKFCKNVKYRPENQGVRTSSSGKRIEAFMERSSKKTDAVFERVQAILGMRKKMEKVKINIYKNSAQLCDAYTAIYKKTCHIRAWYRFRDNTIYINASDFHEGVLAHELAHAVVDNYLSVRPPRATAEIIARYVDSHLKKKVPSYDTPEPFLGLRQ